MIHEEQTWNASELIYLFVDGEATDVQKSTLFSALANDTDLQTEFADALQINAAAESERGAIIPPTHVTAGLFEKAGISAGAATASGVARTGMMVGTGASIGLAAFFRKAATPVVSAFLGAAIALFLVPEIAPWINNANPGSEAIVQSSAPVANQGRTLSGQNKQAGVITQNSVAEKNRTSVRHSSGNNQTSLKHSSRQAPQGNAKTPAPANGLGNETALSSVEKAGQLPATVQAPVSAEETLAVRLSMAPNGTPHTAEDIEDLKHQTVSSQRSKTDGDIPATPEAIMAGATFPRLAVQLRGMADIEMFPHRSLPSTSAPAFGNIALTAFYNVSRNHAIGIEAGREYHPLYVTAPPPVLEEEPDVSGTQGDQTDGPGIIFNDANNLLTPTTITGNARFTTDESDIQSYELESFSQWIGLSYRYRADEMSSILPLRPFVQTLIGASNFGPIGKAMAGFSWQPDSRVTFSLGLEGTSIFYRQDGAWYSTRKLGASYAAQVEF